MQGHSDIYDQISAFYMLLYPTDIQKYQLGTLEALLLRLQGQLELDQVQKVIHQELESISKSNMDMQQKKRKQRILQKNQLRLKSLNASQNNSMSSSIKKQSRQTSERSQLYHNQSYVSINESVIIPKPKPQQIKVLSQLQGKIFDGKRLISIKTSNPTTKKQQKLSFQVDSSKKSTSISATSWDSLIGKQIHNNQTDLLLQNRKVKVQLGSANIIGLDYLSQNGIIIICNYRSQDLKFTMSYTI